MKVAVRDLKNRLSEYLRRVRAGERLIVTDRGRPIAELSPIGRRRLTTEDRIRQLVDAGEITPGKGVGLPDIEPLQIRGKPVSETILEDRD